MNDRRNKELAHHWWYNTDPAAVGHASNFYWSGDTIYSYGPHFPIARKTKQGVLYNRNRFSQTTSKHQLYVRCAIPRGMSVVEVDNVNAHTVKEHRNNRDLLLQGIIYELDKAGYAPEKVKVPVRRKLIFELNNYKLYCKKFNMPEIPARTDVVLPKGWKKHFDSNILQVLEDLESEHQFKVGERRAANRHIGSIEDSQEKAKTEIEAWKKHKRKSIFRRAVAFLRISKDGDHVETSQGVTVTKDQFLKGYVLLSRIDAGSEELGGKVADRYDIQGVSEKYVQVGCHNIPREEIAYIKNLLDGAK